MPIFSLLNFSFIRRKLLFISLRLSLLVRDLCLMRNTLLKRLKFVFNELLSKMASTESFENPWKMFVYGKVPNQKNMWNFCILRSVSFIFSCIEGNYMMYFRYMRYGEEIDEYFRKCDHLLKKSLMENLIFCAVLANSTTSSNSTLLNGKKKLEKIWI